MCVGLDLYYFELEEAGAMVRSEKHFVDTYGEVGKAFVDAYDKCCSLHLDHHYFDGWDRKHNDYARYWNHPKCRNYSAVYSFSTFSSGGYNKSVELKDWYSYKECYINIEELGIDAIRFMTKLLNESAQKVIDYREKNKWQGEIDMDGYAKQLQANHPNLTIEVREGKRGCDGDCKPYKAIVVYEDGSQLGSITMNIGFNGVASISKRVPLCGENSFDTNNENVMKDLESCVEFITS